MKFQNQSVAPWSVLLTLTAITCLSAAGCGYTDEALEDPIRESGAAVERGADEDAEPARSEGDERTDETAETDAPTDDDRAGRSDDEVSVGGWPVGAYRGYLCEGDLFIATDDISRGDALDNCTLNAASNPELALWCTWNDELIYDGCGRDREERGEAPALCGLFRGGLSEGEHMIASPNPATSVDDTDEACAEYCAGSGAQPGDVCVRGGVVVATYNADEIR